MDTRPGCTACSVWPCTGAFLSRLFGGTPRYHLDSGLVFFHWIWTRGCHSVLCTQRFACVRKHSSRHRKRDLDMATLFNSSIDATVRSAVACAFLCYDRGPLRESGPKWTDALWNCLARFGQQRGEPRTFTRSVPRKCALSTRYPRASVWIRLSIVES